MKGNKMSAILAILVMLMGTLTGAMFVLPHAFAQADAAAMVPNVLPSGATNVNVGNGPFTAYAYNTLENITGLAAGTHFPVYIDVINVTGLFSYQVGFKFDTTIFQIINATGPGQYTGSGSPELASHYFLSHASDVDGNASDATVNSNSTGLVPAQGFYLTSAAQAVNGSGLLLKVWMMINPSYSAPYTDTAPGGIVPGLMNFSVTETDIQTIMVYKDGSTIITPLASHVINGTVVKKEVVLASHGPTASFTITPNPAYVGTEQAFDASASTGAFNGTTSTTEPITAYYWNFGDGNLTTTTTPLEAHKYAAVGSYTVTLIVHSANISPAYQNSTAATEIAMVIAKPTGCNIDFYTQNWRYIDPFYIDTAYTGGALSPVPGLADTFRPGDLVELFANVTYNGAPVQGGLVTFQVWDPYNNTVLVATAISSCYGLAQWEFRVPWPSTEGVQVNNFSLGSFAPQENTTLFGMWKAEATWQLGSQLSELPPFEKTQNATLKWDVSWGLQISIVSITPNPAVRGPASCGYGSDVVVKVNVYNEYLESVPGLITVTLYDNLLVPIYPPGSMFVTDFPVGNSQWSMPSIEIPSYAFVGTAYAVANLLSTWPVLAGTAYC